MKTLVLAMMLALALVLCGLALAQDSTTCTTSRDGLHTWCRDSQGNSFGMKCADVDGEVTCEHYYHAWTPPGKSCATLSDGRTVCAGDSTHPKAPGPPVTEKDLEKLAQETREEKQEKARAEQRARDFDVQMLRLTPCPKRSEQRDDRGECLDPKSYKKRLAEAQAEVKARAAEIERKAHDELCAAHQLRAEKCKP